MNVASEVDFSVEVDARRSDPWAIETFVSQGMNRATLSVQDFDQDVQLAIGRLQSEETTRKVVENLRAAGVGNVGIDVLYGLPRQTRDNVRKTVEAVVAMAPDRVSLQGYAHMPWMAKRQRMIDERDLPIGEARQTQYETAFDLLSAAGYRPVGIEHFAREGDPLLDLAQSGQLRRRHLAYTDDRLEAVIGIGASAVSSFRHGRVQNEQCTKTYRAQADEGRSAAYRGTMLSLEDKVRGRAIEMLVCSFGVDLVALKAEFGDFSNIVRPGLEAAKEKFGARIRWDSDGFRIVERGPALARRVARCLDPLHSEAQRYSYAI